MSALIKCYWDEACTDEIFFDVQSYSITMGPRTGLNGDAGEVVNQYIYLKNVGDVTAQRTVVKEVGDLQEYFRISTPSADYATLRAPVGDVAPGEIVPIILHSIIPKHTAQSAGILRYTIEYYTLPSVTDITEAVAYTQPEHKLQYTGDNPLPVDARSGRPYGYGPYGNPIWGQEGFIHKQTTINGTLPIAGLHYTYITADYVINARYNGTEATIEDVQSYYTESYMALECFDGPALPLWLNKYDEDVLQR